MVNLYKLHNVKLNLIEFNDLVNYITNIVHYKKGYICLPDLYVLSYARKHSSFTKILNDSLFTLIDGKPIEFILKYKGVKNARTTSGYCLCKELLRTNLGHYFLGPNDETNESIKINLLSEFPQGKIVGFSSLPLLQFNEIHNNPQINRIINKINLINPDIIWIGISSPKQDILMHSFCNKLNNGIMIGVGGVFDYLAGNTKISPEWIKKIGFRWLYRLIQNPKKYYRKNLSNFQSILQFIRENS